LFEAHRKTPILAFEFQNANEAQPPATALLFSCSFSLRLLQIAGYCMGMRERAILVLSLGLNIVLVCMLLSVFEEWGLVPGHFRVETHVTKPITAKTNIVVRRQLFNWVEVESSEFPTFIANLRRIGCPEQTIKDIILAEVDRLYEKRERTEVVLPDQEWWRSDPETNAVQSAAYQIQALEAEKAALLVELLGPDWNHQPETPSGDPLRLDGPILSKLSPEIKEAVLKIAVAARDQTTAYLAQKSGAKEEPSSQDLERIREQERSELVKILTPEQLEEFQLRYSNGAVQMRQELHGFEANADEFRSIFRIRDSYDRQIQALDAKDPASANRRVALQRARDQAVSQVISPERYPLYVMSQDPVFRQVQTSAEQSGVPAEKVLPIYQVNRATQMEIERIRNDASLSEADKAAALQTIQSQQQASIKKIISGENAANSE
jgi:hypothetical protein